MLTACRFLADAASSIFHPGQNENRITRKRPEAPPSMPAADGEFDRVAQRVLPGRSGEQLERIARHRAIVAGAFDRVFERAMLFHRHERYLEVAVDDLALLQRPAPEFAFARTPAPERQH